MVRSADASYNSRTTLLKNSPIMMALSWSKVHQNIGMCLAFSRYLNGESHVSGHYWNLIHLKSTHDNLNDIFEELVPPRA